MNRRRTQTKSLLEPPDTHHDTTETTVSDGFSHLEGQAPTRRSVATAHRPRGIGAPRCIRGSSEGVRPSWQAQPERLREMAGLQRTVRYLHP